MMDPLSMLEIFRSYGRESPYSKLNPLTKFFLFVVFIIIPLISPSIFIQIFSLLMQTPLIIMSHSTNRITRSLRASTFFIIILIILNYLTTFNIIFSISMVLRLIGMIIASAIFMTGTDPAEIGDLLSKLRIPFQISFSFVIALRFIPVLADDVMMIITSQASRGYEIEKGGFLERIKRMIPILIPMIIIAIRRGHQLAEALETKAFGASDKRTSYMKYRVNLLDLLMVSYGLLTLIAGFLIVTTHLEIFPLLQL